jgi:hypothetical protein
VTTTFLNKSNLVIAPKIRANYPLFFEVIKAAI